jgi:hypothetical protein
MNEYQVGEVVQWGPLEYPHVGIVRHFSTSAEFAFVEDSRGVYHQVRVSELRR